jgi:endonuclease-3
MSAPEINTIIKLLRKRYGNPKPAPSCDPLGELVQTILSQNTSDINSHAAYGSLLRQFTSWEDILTASTDMIARPISGGGLGRIKAQRIHQSLQQIQQKQGKLDLSFLENLSITEARGWLKQLPGVGDKTANCVLLFAFGKPALPVDTHIFRVAKRLRLLREKANLKDAHQLLEKIVPAMDVYVFHVLMIEHGRRTCIARRPLCPQCVLNIFCPSYAVFTMHPAMKKGT